MQNLEIIAPWNIYPETDLNKRLPPIIFGAATFYLGYTRGGMYWVPFGAWAGSPLILMVGIGLIMGLAG